MKRGARAAVCRWHLFQRSSVEFFFFPSEGRICRPSATMRRIVAWPVCSTSGRGEVGVEGMPVVWQCTCLFRIIHPRRAARRAFRFPWKPGKGLIRIRDRRTEEIRPRFRSRKPPHASQTPLLPVFGSRSTTGIVFPGIMESGSANFCFSGRLDFDFSTV